MIQSALLPVTGPLMFPWADIIDNDLHIDEEAEVNMHDVLDMTSHTSVDGHCQ